MRKYFLSIVALAAGLFATSCQESIVEPQIAGPTTFTVQFPEQMGTKADIGSANNVNNLFVAVYAEAEPDAEAIFKKQVAVENGVAKVTLNLIQDQSYDIVFWAQKGTSYVDANSELLSIPMKNTFHNSEEGAAFFHFEDEFTPNGAPKDIILRRPFAQLNLGTTPASLKTDVQSDSLKLSQSYIKVEKVAATFNTVLGVGEGEQTIEFALANVPSQKLYVGGVKYYYVSMDYLPIAGDDQALVNVNAKIKLDNGQVIDHPFTSVPVRENYRTNIVGNLISSTTDFEITIEDSWSGYYDIPEGEWDGQTMLEPVKDENGVYQISHPSHLAWLAAAVNGTLPATKAETLPANDFDNTTFALSSDIDLCGYEWTPIGKGVRSGRTFTEASTPFKGIFEGNGYTIKNLVISQYEEADAAIGFFGVVSGGTVQNVNFENVNINVNNSEIAGTTVGLLTDGGVVTNVEVISGKVYAARGNGGVVGRLTDRGRISDCTNNAEIKSLSGANVGGIVAAAYYTAENLSYTGEDAAIIIEDCINNGAIIGAAGGVGGIAGLSTGRVFNCSNTSDIQGANASVGGIVGEQQNAGEIISCMNTGNINNNVAPNVYGTGGIVGWIRYSGASNNYETKNVVTVNECINTGNIKGGNDAGGIVGTLYHYGIITNNRNSAKSLEAVNFAAGIVANYQVSDKTHPGMDESFSAIITGNQTTTLIEDIKANCKDLVIYDNTQGEYTTIGNNIVPTLINTADDLRNALANAVDNTVIVLEGVDFGAVDLYNTTNNGHRYNYANYNAKNVKIIGKDGASFSELRMGENDYEPTMTGWTFKNISFSSGDGLIISMNNDGVTVDNCKFTNAELQNTGTNTYQAKNFLVNECTFEGSHAGRKTQLALQNSDGVTISNCKFNNAAYNAMNITNIHGNVTIKGNIINQTANRPLRFSVAAAGATLNIQNNNITSNGDVNGELMKVSAETGATVVESNITRSNNVWNGKDDSEVVSGMVDGAYIVKKVYVVNNAAELQTAIKNGGKIEFANDITVDKWIMFSEDYNIGDGTIITIDEINVTIDGKGHTLTVNAIESAGNGDQLFQGASNLNISNLTIKYADGLTTGGLGLVSGVIKNVHFVGGGASAASAAIFPGNGVIKVEDCIFDTNGAAIYFEDERDKLTVTGCTFNQPAGKNVILLRGNVQFTENIINSGRTVNIVSGSPFVDGNDFNNVRLKVYGDATATVSNNTINTLEFEKTYYKSTFVDNDLSTDAQAALSSVTKVN